MMILTTEVPSGLTLSLVSIMVVFSALIILVLIFSILGRVISSRQNKKTPRDINSDEIAAAIALALHLHTQDTSDGLVHDTEPGVITIKHLSSPWDNKSLNFRKAPRK